MTRSPASFCLLATGWGLLGFALVQNLAPLEMTLMLGTIVFAECLSAAINPRILFESENAGQNYQDALAKMLFCWVLLCLVLIPLFQLQHLPFYQDRPSAVLSLLALTLVLSLVKFNAQGHPSAHIFGSLRLVSAAAALLGVNWVGGTGIQIFLSSLMLSHLLVLLGIILLARRTAVRSQQEQHIPFDALCRYADVLILPVVLGGSEALLYLVARCLSITVSIGLSHLGGRAMPMLITGQQQGNDLQFVTMAARLNLGFLLVGGSIAIAVVTAAPYIANSLQFADDSFRTILLWLVLGVSSPVLFGATEALLCAMGKHNIIFLANVISSIFLVGAISLAGYPTALFMAKCFAGIQLAKSGVCAVILVHYAGVWPGLTALLLRQIKLF